MPADDEKKAAATDKKDESIDVQSKTKQLFANYCALYAQHMGSESSLKKRTNDKDAAATPELDEDDGDDDDTTTTKTGSFEKWQAEFANKNTEYLFELILFTDTLLNDDSDNKKEKPSAEVTNSLKSIAMHYAAQLSINRTPEQIRKLFGFESGFSEARQRQIIQEAKWCEEY